MLFENGQMRKEWTQSGRPGDSVDERDSRVSVVRVGEKDPRKGRTQVG